jgi:CxxC motif-containing protein (DUF1111 family)
VDAVQTTGKPPTGQANVATNDDSIPEKCPIDPEVLPCDPICIAPEPEEAPAAFDNKTNEFIKQGDPIPPGATPTPGTFEADKFIFSVVEEIEDGLGPVYNAQSCRECHQNPVTGAISQINELRAGHLERPGGPHPCLACPPIFVDAPGGSLINDRATNPKVQERVPPLFSAGIDNEEDVRTFRTSLNTLGDGFVEAISNQTLLDIAASQPDDETSGHLVHGQTINVPVEEADPTSDVRCRVGRFGHKDQHASLLSFSGDAYLNEMGITNRLFLMENTSLGRPVEDIVPGIDPIPNDAEIPCDPPPFPVPGQQKRCGEDPEFDIDAFAQFMRATKAPPRDKEIADSEKGQIGAKLFFKAGCAVCHVNTILTAQEGTIIDAGTFKVPKALGSKFIHPFGDFLLHDIDTGDGIVQNGGASTRLKVRTAPLWGVRTRTRLMHDGASLTFMDAILRHAGEAEIVRQNFEHFTPEEQTLLIIFLESL